jgi:siroheme synthase
MRTRPDERVLQTTLAELPALAASARLRSPTLLVVGQVAALAQVRGAADDGRQAVDSPVRLQQKE